MSFLKQLINVPQKTIQQLIRGKQSSKLKKISKNSNILSNKATQQNNDINIKSPYYINRFQKIKHTLCHLEGECLGCQYSKLKQFQIKVKKPFLHSHSHRNYKYPTINRVKTQRQSEEQAFTTLSSIKRRLRASQGTQLTSYNTLIKNIQLKIKYMDKKLKDQIYRKTGKLCDDPEIIKLILNFFVPNMQAKQFYNHEKLQQILQQIKRANFDECLKQKQIFSSIMKIQVKKDKKLVSKKSNKSITTQIKKINAKKGKQNATSIKVIPDQEEVKKGPHKQKKNQLKKVLFEQSDDSELAIKATEICSKFLIGDQPSLTEQVKQTLNQLAKKKYKYFKHAIQNIDTYLHQQICQNPIINQMITKKVEIAADYVKKCISPSDVNQNLKHAQVDKLVRSVHNMPNTNRRKSSLQHTQNPNQTSINMSRFCQQDDTNIIQSQPRSLKSNERSRRKSTTKKKKSYYRNETNQDSPLDKNPDYSQKSTLDKALQNSKSNQFSSDNTLKLIQQQGNDYVICEQMTRSGKKISSKKSDLKIQVGKVSFLKHGKSQQIQVQQKLFFGKHNEYVINSKSPTKKNINMMNLDQKQKIQYITQRKFYKAQDRKISSQAAELFGLEKQKKRKIFLKLKAAELLKQNQQLIQKVQVSLKNMNLSNYIINQTDCVLTQKKKIRALRQLIRIRSTSQDLQIQMANQILEYLLVYEENYQILIQKFPQDTSKPDQQNVREWKKFVGKKQILNQLIFYDLNHQFVFGRAEEDEINYNFAKQKYDDRSWQISSKNIFNNTKFQDLCKSQQQATIVKQQREDNLVQQEMTERCFAQNYAYGSIS